MNLEQVAKALERMAVLLEIEIKSVSSVVRKFHADLRNLSVLAFVSGDSILSDTRQLVRTAIEDAYIAGLEEGGVDAEELENDDEIRIASLQAEQEDYITQFAKDARAAAKDKAAQRDILDNRINLWTATIQAAGQSGLNSAKANEMVTWRLGKTEEPCRDCTRLNGQSHRRKWFDERGLGTPGKPGQQTECGGYNCDCRLEPKK